MIGGVGSLRLPSRGLVVLWFLCGAVEDGGGCCELGIGGAVRCCRMGSGSGRP